MSKVPWYPLGSRSKNAKSSSRSTNYAETVLNSSSFSGGINRHQPEQYGTKRKLGTDQQVGGKQKPVLNPSRPVRSYVQYKHRTDFTPEELAEKRRIAIEEEAVKKKERDKIAQKKLEERWVRLGKIICSLNPNDFGLNETPVVDDTCTLDETLANVLNFTKNLNALVGSETKGTVFAHSLGFAGALCNVPTKSFLHVERRVISSKQLKEEMEQREKEAKARMDECWIEIGKAICSFTLGEFGVTIKDSSYIASNESEINEPEINKKTVVESDDIEATTSRISNRVRKEKDADSGESEDEDYVEEEDDEDYEELSSKRSRSKKSKKGLANRGEDVVANFFNFSTALRDMMDIHSKQSCLRSPYEFTSVICNLAEKSVRDRHTAKRIEK
ncbi:unnamed protein product [Caenorhabditis brenneri]